MNKPNADSANTDSLPGGLDAFMSGWVMENLDDQLPARVVSYDAATNRAVLQPLVMIGMTDGSRKMRAQVSNIPVFRYGAGGFFIRHPVQPGDFGWIKANDRDISLVIQRGGQPDWPNTERRHNFSDAMFYPDTLKDWVVAPADAEAMTLQSLDGVSVVSVAPDNVEVRRGANIARVDDAQITATVGASSIIINAASITLTAGGSVLVISSAGVTHNGVSIGDTHRHDGVTPGVGNTGEPI